MGSRSNASGFNFISGEEEKIYFGGGGETMPPPPAAAALQGATGAAYGSTSSSSSSRRAVQSNNASSSSSSQGQQGQQQMVGRCQVEGCGVDLSGAKAYYCKHRVCGPHSKAPRVVVGGIEQRFCQQCSRFHLLSEFDQGKRSCRRRLAGHNERRRKPPSGPLSHARQFSPFFHEVDAAGSSGFVMDFTRPSTAVPFVSSQPRQIIPNRPQIGSQPFVRTPTNPQLILSNPNETLNLVGGPNSTSARSLLSSPVQWGRPASTGDSFQDPFNFTHLHAGTSSSPNHGYTGASLVHPEHHIGLDMMEGHRPVTETVQYSGSGQLGSGSALHANNSGSMNDDNDRNYEHGDGGGSSHDLIQWSL